MSRGPSPSLAFALAWLSASSASAFVSRTDPNHHPLHWNLTQPDVHTNVVNPVNHAVRYFVSSDAFSSANRTAELNAVHACFDQWQAIPGTDLKFELGGLLPGRVDVNTADNTNVIFWVKGTTLVAGGNADIRGSTAFTFFDYFSDSTLAEADIVLNGTEFSWSTDFNNTDSSAQFIEAILLHEIGHFIGLDHSPVGGATMLARSLSGVSTQAGLSSDEFEAARALYPNVRVLATLGHLQGTVTRNGSPILGAVLTLEDQNGNMSHGTVTDFAGHYDLPALPPGIYLARVSPLDPAAASFPLLRGSDIGNNYVGAETSFLPSAAAPVTVSSATTTSQNFQVIAAEPPLRVSRIGKPGPFPTVFTVVNAAVTIKQGTQNNYFAVYTTQPVSSAAHFTITGNGITLGPATVLLSAVANMNLISESIQVADNALPGLRTIILRDGDQIAYANGFLEILPPIPDYNFDGLDDRFQRQYFPLWTAPEAAPNADPDGDGFSNMQEYQAGTDPTNAQSFRFKILSVKLSSAGATVTFETALGKKYQLYRRQNIATDPWESVGSPVTARGASAQVLDPNANGGFHFYQVRTIP